MKKRILSMFIIFIMMTTLLIGCSSKDVENNSTGANSENAETSLDKKKLKVGTFATSAIAAEAGISTLEELGYEVEVVFFDDVILPNKALQEGTIDFNIMQHAPYLKAYMDSNQGTELTMAKLFYYPNYGLYSSRYDSVENLPDGATIGLYNDPSNIDRGLRILETNGLIKFIDEEKDMYSDMDIVENPKNFKFEMVGFGTAVRAMEDLDACMAASSHILQAGLDPKKVLIMEDREKTSIDFTCGIAIRAEDLETNWVKDLIKAYTSEASAKHMNENYKGATVPAF